jgi:hypothetical protein
VVEIADSARNHGITDDDIRHALQVPMREVWQGERLLLVIAADPTGRLLELVVLDAETDPCVIHADKLRAKFHRYLNPQR